MSVTDANRILQRMIRVCYHNTSELECLTPDAMLVRYRLLELIESLDTPATTRTVSAGIDRVYVQ